ncbi:helix-turn-helix domain-containing protein [Acidiphilium sp. JA12-A1]|uniref:helix-turn-helix domain-containing protein n=1 Tax=Acidiphilium sp. JA12-A1 TaxID=1464546 RepID=UPI000461DB2B|nr:helix-turn-helix domain-containing protein [Acidiphilium sp. JA12-A1]KDM66824.1 helix-turn-helix domain-containing protein-containing protein [Acidiphilium sp. JA12-A1]
MPRAIALRTDLNVATLRCLARRSQAAPAPRLLALAAINDGGTRSEAARLGHVTLQIVRDWVIRFNAEGLDRLRDLKARGATATADRGASPGTRPITASRTTQKWADHGRPARPSRANTGAAVVKMACLRVCRVQFLGTLWRGSSSHFIVIFIVKWMYAHGRKAICPTEGIRSDYHETFIVTRLMACQPALMNGTAHKKDRDESDDEFKPASAHPP